MSNRRIGHHAFHARLPDRHKIADCHCNRRNNCHKRGPIEAGNYTKIRTSRRERSVKEPDQESKPRSFGPNRKESGNHRRRSLKDIGQPEMERNRCNLVSKANKNQSERD